MPGLPVRWVPAGNIHLTLAFLGDVSTSNVPAITSELQAEAVQHTPFEFAVGNLGAFPNANRPRVVWVGIEAPPVLGELQSGVAIRMKRLGYASDDRDFTPHLTLGRVSRSAGQVEVHRIGECVQKTEVGQLGIVNVHSVHLFRSDLRPTGPVYERISTSPLGVLTPGV